MRQINKIKAIRQALEALDPEPSFLQPAADHRAVHGHGQFVCPNCGHGAHGDGLQAMQGSPARWWCYGCGKAFDLIDLMQAANGMSNPADAAEACRQYFGLIVPEIDSEERGGKAWNDQPLSWEASESAVNFGGTPQQGQAGQQAGKPEGKGQTMNAQQQKAPELNKQGEKLNDEKYSRECREFVNRCHQNAKNTAESADYFRRRGLPAEFLDRFNLGFCPDFPNGAPISEEHRAKGHTTPGAAYGTGGRTFPAVIIPLGDGSRFVARDISIPSGTEDKAAKMNRYRFSSSPRPLFNPEALAGDKPVFIVEGQIDAMSIIAAGGQAVALGGAGDGDLLWRIEEARPRWPLIIATDADSAGEKQAAGLIKDFENPARPKLAGLKYIAASECLYGNYKDANEALTRDPAGFTDRVRVTEKAAIEYSDKDERQKEADYMAEHDAGLNELIADQEDMTPRVKTCFWTFNDMIGDGLKHSTTYTLAAMPSVGKSALALQIAMYIAADYGTNKRDVLFFALEMSRPELISRAISALTAAEAIEKLNTHYHEQYKSYTDNQLKCDNWAYAAANNVQRYHYDSMPREMLTEAQFEAKQDAMEQAARKAGAVSANFIWEGVKRRRLDSFQLAKADSAQAKYTGSIHPHMFILRGRFTIKQIYEAVDRHIAMRKRQDPDMLAPVIFLDYLQVMGKEKGERYTSDREKISDDSEALKDIAVKYKTPVFYISSVNRNSYGQDGDMSAVKGSGDIEFNTDFLFLLQFARQGRKDYDFNKEKGRPVRAVKLVMHKGRGERASDTPVYFNYFPQWNYYAGTLTPPPFPPEEKKKDEKPEEPQEAPEDALKEEDDNGGNAVTQERMTQAAGTLILEQKPDTIANVAKLLKCTPADIKKFVAEHSDCWRIEDGRAIYTNPYTAREAAERGAQAGDAADAIEEYDDTDGENAPF